VTTHRQQFGTDTEDAAAAFLEQRGYRIVARNFRIRQGEVDIIAEDGEVLCFVEVKASRSLRFGDPLERVGHQKRRRLIKAARVFLARHPVLAAERDIRFDVITIHATASAAPSAWTIEHLPDAFRSD